MKTVVAFALLTLCIIATQSVSAVSFKILYFLSIYDTERKAFFSNKPVPFYVNSEQATVFHISHDAIVTLNANPDIYSNLLVAMLKVLTSKHYNVDQVLADVF